MKYILKLNPLKIQGHCEYTYFFQLLSNLSNNRVRLTRLSSTTRGLLKSSNREIVIL